MFKVTFGSASKRSIVAQLCTDEERNDLLHGLGKYSAMRNHPGIRNDTMYAYLRLGITSHAAVAFQALGYTTPESLTESDVVGPMLPDILSRTDREYPLEFIDRCEQEGIAAVECQAALRRGIMPSHLDGALDTAQLITTFNRYVRREGLGVHVNNVEKSIIDYFVDGTLPIELQSERSLSPENITAVARYLSKNAPEFLDELRADIPRFSNFIKATRTGMKNGVQELRRLVLLYGREVLDLYNPYLCAAKFHEGDGSKKAAGLGLAQYIESIGRESRGDFGLWQIKISGTSVGFSGKNLELADIDAMHAVGVTPQEIKEHVLEGDMFPAALIVSKADGIQSSLMAGGL
jgi:hypothetical protein